MRRFLPFPTKYHVEFRHPHPLIIQPCVGLLTVAGEMNFDLDRGKSQT